MRNGEYLYNLDFDQSDCDFIVKEEERKVICLVNRTSNLFFNYMTSKLPADLVSHYMRCGISQTLTNQLVMPNSFVGIATCNEEDEWNEETGRLIAFKRAKEKVVNSFFKRVNIYVAYQRDTLNAFVNHFTIESARAQADITHRNEYVESKIGISLASPLHEITYFKG